MNKTFLWMITLIWAVILGVFTCTNDLVALLDHQSIGFQWVSHPHFADLLILSDAHPTQPFWLLIKTGHLLGFAFLEICVFYLCRTSSTAAWTAVLYGIATEMLQLYFHRDGRFLDMGIDALGVMLSYSLQNLYRLIWSQRLAKLEFPLE